MDITLASLYADIRRHGSIPNSGGTGSENSDLLAYMNHNLTGLQAEVIKCREGFYRMYKDHTLGTSVRYRIPTRALGNRLDCILLLDSNGKVLRKLNEVAYQDVSNFRNLTDTMGYHLEAGDVVLTPTVPSGTAVTLRMVYYIRAGALSSSLDVASGKCFTVTGVSGNVISILSSHGITTSMRIDIVKGGSPFESLTVDELPSATGSTTVTVADGSRVEIGDFVCLADYSPMPQVPDAFWPALAISAAKDYWMALGDEKMVARLDKELWGDGKKNKGIVGQAVDLIAPRVEEGGKKIKSPYGAMGALYGPARRVY